MVKQEKDLLMRLKEIYAQTQPVISYEVFPPKDDPSGQKLKTLMKELEVLRQYNPSLVSVSTPSPIAIYLTFSPW